MIVILIIVLLFASAWAFSGFRAFRRSQWEMHDIDAQDIDLGGLSGEPQGWES